MSTRFRPAVIGAGVLVVAGVVAAVALLPDDAVPNPEGASADSSAGIDGDPAPTSPAPGGSGAVPVAPVGDTPAAAGPSGSTLPPTWGTGPTGSVVTDPRTAAPVTVLMTYGEWNPQTGAVEAGAVVQGVLEAEGTCTLLLVGNGQSQEAVVSAEPDVATMSCGGLSVPDVAPGTYEATIAYASDRSEAVSDEFTIEVPR